MTDIQRIDEHFYLREGPFEVGEARDEQHAKRWAKADALMELVEKMIPLIPETRYGSMSFPHPIVREAEQLLELLR